MTDSELLEEFARSGSPEAYSELARAGMLGSRAAAEEAPGGLLASIQALAGSSEKGSRNLLAYAISLQLVASSRKGTWNLLWFMSFSAAQRLCARGFFPGGSLAAW